MKITSTDLRRIIRALIYTAHCQERLAADESEGETTRSLAHHFMEVNRELAERLEIFESGEGKRIEVKR